MTACVGWGRGAFMLFPERIDLTELNGAFYFRRKHCELSKPDNKRLPRSRTIVYRGIKSIAKYRISRNQVYAVIPTVSVKDFKDFSN